MKINIKAILIAILLLSLTFVVFSQVPEIVPPAESASFPFWALIPLLVGMALHWAKGYTRGTIPTTFWDYLIGNISLTISALVASVGQLMIAWTSAPEVFSTNPYFMAWTLFLMGYGSDSALNGSGPFIKK